MLEVVFLIFLSVASFILELLQNIIYMICVNNYTYIPDVCKENMNYTIKFHDGSSYFFILYQDVGHIKTIVFYSYSKQTLCVYIFLSIQYIVKRSSFYFVVVFVLLIHSFIAHSWQGWIKKRVHISDFLVTFRIYIVEQFQ